MEILAFLEYFYGDDMNGKRRLDGCIDGLLKTQLLESKAQLSVSIRCTYVQMCDMRGKYHTLNK